MSVESWVIVILALFLLFPFHAAADVPDPLDPSDFPTTELIEEAETTEETEAIEETEAPPETVENDPEPIQDPTEDSPSPTVAPFDFVLLEESSVKAVERLDQLVEILTGMMFFLGVCSGILFFKVLSDKVHV